MKTLILFLTLGITVSVFGQQKIALSLQASPIYTYGDSRFVFPFPDPTTQLPSTDFAAVSNGISYSLGVNARYAFSPNWSIATGIWATHTVSLKSDYTKNGIASTVYYKYNHPLTNLYKIPLLLNYQPSVRRLTPYFSAGVTLDFRGITYVDIDGSGNLVAVQFGNKPVVITPLVGAGILYRFKERLSLIVQPTLQYDLDPHPSYNYFHAYQVGLQIQLMYNL